jgi:hypothetical protein
MDSDSKYIDSARVDNSWLSFDPVREYVYAYVVEFDGRSHSLSAYFRAPNLGTFCSSGYKQRVVALMCGGYAEEADCFW